MVVVVVFVVVDFREFLLPFAFDADSSAVLVVDVLLPPFSLAVPKSSRTNRKRHKKNFQTQNQPERANMNDSN